MTRGHNLIARRIRWRRCGSSRTSGQTRCVRTQHPSSVRQWLGVPNGTAHQSVGRLLFSEISEAASELGARPERHQEKCYEVCASTPEYGVPLLWTPIRRNQPRQRRRMRRRAATRSGSTHSSLASMQTECPCRFSTCDGSTPDLNPAHFHRLSRQDLSDRFSGWCSLSTSETSHDNEQGHTETTADERSH